MEHMNWLGVGLGTLAFWLVGALWYGLLFSKAWQRETGITEPPSGAGVAKVMALTLALEFLVVLTLAHMFAFDAPTSQNASLPSPTPSQFMCSIVPSPAFEPALAHRRVRV